jgi:hypothetical protein
MHYKDGTEAMVGDIARGKGFNIPYEIVAPVTKLKPEGGKCNLELKVVKATLIPGYNDGDGGIGWIPEQWTFDMIDEYGDVSEFELIYRKGWKRVQSRNLVWEKSC